MYMYIKENLLITMVTITMSNRYGTNYIFCFIGSNINDCLNFSE